MSMIFVFWIKDKIDIPFLFSTRKKWNRNLSPYVPNVTKPFTIREIIPFVFRATPNVIAEIF